MKLNLDHIKSQKYAGEEGDDGGAWRFKRHGVYFNVVASWGGGWDHVSMSLPNRCPTWEEMCWVKDQFFEAEESVMQLHPPRSEYVNNHPFCLHLWRPQETLIPLPPAIFVGIPGVQTVLAGLPTNHSR